MKTTRFALAAGILAASPLALHAQSTGAVCQQLTPGRDASTIFVGPEGLRAPNPGELESLMAAEAAKHDYEWVVSTEKSGAISATLVDHAAPAKTRTVVATIPIQPRGGAKAAPYSNFIIVSLDGGGEGVNDGTAATPEGGNPGVTLGAQRANAMTEALSYWADRVQSNIDIEVEVDWAALPCNAGGGVLGSAGTNTVHGNWAPAGGGSSAPFINTWYHQALANSIANQDNDGVESDIFSSFNSDMDNNPSCVSVGGLGVTSIDWYYGYDGSPTSTELDFFDTFKHEVAHGLCFSTFVDTETTSTPATGGKFFGSDDVFMQFLYDPTISPSDWPSMSDGQRSTSMVNNGNLLWDDAGVTALAASLPLTSGTGSGGRVRMYAPLSLTPGSSVSHWDEVLLPHELMEPIADPSPDDSLTQAAFLAMGWGGALVPVELDQFGVE